ncbi:MAG: Holliday junction ATP-dependent DNA helicase RuvA [Rhodomicrobium sp.]|nr:MAG: Holliday junction ATP-dependent DNA helicase RuvA [Rhodomicrobium sp.]
MIGKLKGIIDSKGEDWVLVDVGGVCYDVHCSARTLSHLPGDGEPVTLAIETHVRETEIRLFGFETEHQREWFRKLQSVQGVGAKVALAILGTLTTTDLANAIALQDKSIVSRAPGVGPKVAARIVAELKDKVPMPAVIDGRSLGGAADISVPAGGRSKAADAVSALTNLGYQGSDASVAVAAAFREVGEEGSVQDLIRLGLKELAR